MDPYFNMINPVYHPQNRNLPKAITSLNEINSRHDVQEDISDQVIRPITQQRVQELPNNDQWSQYFSLGFQITQEHPKSQKPINLHREGISIDYSTQVLSGDNHMGVMDQSISEPFYKKKKEKPTMQKNIPTYIRQLMINILLYRQGPCKQKVQELCKKRNIQFSQLLQYCKKSNFKNDKNFFTLLNKKQGSKQMKMNKFLKHLLLTMLRKAYLPTILRHGKMQKSNYSSYILKKNIMLQIPQMHN